MKNKKTGYDIIGDIHGHATTLEALLKNLGYERQKDGVCTHPLRKVIFLGDFIDRGQEQKEVLELVKPMIESGSAKAVMGNHEFNAICYHTRHPESGNPLREHSNKNSDSHQAFLNAYPLNKEDTGEVIAWFKTLPLFIELPDFRVVHACWNDQVLAGIKPLLNPDNTLSDEL